MQPADQKTPPPDAARPPGAPSPGKAADSDGTDAVVHRKRRLHIPFTALNIASLLLALGLWFMIGAIGIRGIPGPIEVAERLRSSLISGVLPADMMISLQRVFLGLLFGVVLAIPVAFVMGWYRTARGLLEPWVQFLRTVPPIALIPLVIVLAGIGEFPKVLIIFFATFLTAVISIYQGVVDVDVTLINAARVLGAKDRHVFLRVVVPASTPYVFVGVRIALAAGWSTLVAAELVASQSGLGYRMLIAGLYFDLPTIYLNLIVIGFLGYSMDRLLMKVEHRLIGWQERR